MPDRFFHSPLKGQLGDLLELADDEAHHISRVLRKVSGDTVELFDGDGGSATAVLVDVRKKGVTAELASDIHLDPPRANQLTIATAAPKADRLKWLVEKATELGVAKLVLLQCERSVVNPGDGKLDKLRATVIAACKQSGRNDLMEVAEPVPVQTVLGTSADRKYIADIPFGDEKTTIPSDGAGSTVAIIGPEGGWIEAERTAAREAGFSPISVGTHILRTETAAIALAAVLTR